MKKKPSAKPAKKPSAKPASKSKSKGENYDRNGGDEPGADVDRVRVFLKISSETGTSVSSCVACDPKSKTAWALDFDGQRQGAAVTLDGVFSADHQEASLYPDVVNQLVNDFMSSSRGVGCLMCYGQAEAGKEAIMYGEAGSRTNFTPRGLPPPGGVSQAQRQPGLVLNAFRTALSHLPVMEQAVRSRVLRGGARPAGWPAGPPGRAGGAGRASPRLPPPCSRRWR